MFSRSTVKTLGWAPSMYDFAARRRGLDVRMRHYRGGSPKRCQFAAFQC